MGRFGRKAFIRFKHKTIGLKIVLALLLASVILIFVFYVFSYSLRMNQAQTDFYHEMNARVERLSNHVGLPLWNYQIDHLLTIIDYELLDENVIAFSLFDTLSATESVYIRDAATQQLRILENGFSQFLNNYHATEAFAATVFWDGEYIAIINIYVTTQFLNEKLKDEIFFVAVNLLGISFFFMLLLYLILRSLVIIPILNVKNIVKDYGKKNFDALPAFMKRDDEIGDLSTGLYTMGCQLKENFRVIEAQNKEIKDSNIKLKAQNLQLSEFNEQMEEMVNSRTKELVRAEKLAALGSMVAGVAHEINTPLGVAVTAITFIADITEDLLAENSQAFSSQELQYMETVKKSTAIIEKNLNRASDLVKSFKLVAADQSSGEKRSFSLVEYIDEILISFYPKLKRAAHKITVSGDRGLSVYSYPGAIYQIISNFLINSLTHAFPDGTPGEIHIKVAKTKDMIELSYADNGCGMTEQTAEHIYEPFYTTKRGSGGTGLGLNIVHNLVAQSLKGRISVRTAKGEGCCFTVIFPQLAD